MATYIPQEPEGAVHAGNLVPVAGVSGAGFVRALEVDASGQLILGNSSSNIGDVDVLTLPALPVGNNNIGDVDVVTQPARVATTDSITAKLATDKLQNGLTALTPLFKAFGTASSGSQDILTANGTKHRVLAAFFMVSAATSIYFLDDTPTTLLGDSTNKIQLAANGGFVLPFNPVGWFETATNKKLQVNLSAANVLSGGIVYVDI